MRTAIALAAALLFTLAAHAQVVSPNLERGFDPQKAYAVEEVGVVNLFNGNLNVTLPIGTTYPVSSTLSYGLALQYGGNNWEYETVEEPMLDENGEPVCQLRDDGTCGYVWLTYGWAYPSRYDNAGFGWRLHLGRLLREPSSGTGWPYESPDGAVHAFYATLHAQTSEADDPKVFYTRDGSYLRMTVDGDAVTVESPDGTTREFNMHRDHPSRGGVLAIRDRFGNSVEVDYGYTGTDVPAPRFGTASTVWRIRDSHNRKHYLYFKPTATYHEQSVTTAVAHESLAEVRVQMPVPHDGGYGVWQFHYIGEQGAPPPWATMRRPTFGVLTHPNTTDYVTAALLEKIVPPAGNEYRFSYDLAGSDTGGEYESSGALKSLTLPTRGKVEWQYVLQHYPPNSTAVINHKNPPALYKSVGVLHRTVRDAAGQITAYREYAVQSDPYMLDDPPAMEKKVTVTDYDATKTTILRKSDNFFSLCSSANCTARGEYGLPFTRKDLPDRQESENGRQLSTITYGLNGDWNAPLQRTFVKYEADIALGGAARGIVDYNRRLQAQRTVHYSTGSSEWTDTESSKFDGLGHYRVTEVTASFGGTSRKTKQNFNPAAGEYAIGGGTFVMPSSWVLETYDSVEVTDTPGQGTARTEYCFASTGFLQRKRTRRFANEPHRDLLVAYSGTGGNVTREEYYGGDGQQLPSTLACTSPIGLTPQYAWTHMYSNGVRSRTTYDGVLFPSVDLDVHHSGLVVASRDTAGSATTFKYDALGRLEELRPDRLAWTQYQYNAAGGAASPANVFVRQWQNGVALTETYYYYDHLGRLIQQRNAMSGVATAPSLPWSAVKTTYDALGRTVAASVATAVASGYYGAFTAPETVNVYDALGRLTRVTQPDTNSVSIVHTGASTTDRTVNIATSATAQTPVKTREIRDGLGRLVSIIENEHLEGTVQKGILTTYRYDHGDRLTGVTAGIQTRTFHYDGAGLLTSETQPEIAGSTEYWYDARGHATRKKTPTATLQMTYDAAERLRTVFLENGTLLQEFTYDTTSKGRMATARRHNRHTDLGEITVTETFQYGGPGGRLSSKETAIRTVSAGGWPTGQTFTESYTYDALGEMQKLTYPGCSGCGSLVPPYRTTQNQFERGYLKNVMGYTKDMKYHPNGMLATLQRLNAGGGDGPLYQQALAWHRMNRPEVTSLSGDCTTLSITRQPQPTTVTPGQPANISVEASGATSYQWFVEGSSTAIDGQSSATLTVAVNTPTRFFARVGNGTCSVDSASALVSLCTPPDATITTAATINPNGQSTASVAGTGTYTWSIENGEILFGHDTREITFRANCTGPVTLRVTVTAAGCPGSSSRSVTVVAPSVTVAATPNPVVAGASTSLSATMSAAGPWTIAWSHDANVTSATTSVVPRRTTEYAVTKVNGCTGTWGSVTVEVTPPPAPVALTAARTAAGIQLTWSVPAGADVDSYTVYRCEMSCVGASGTALPGAVTAPAYLDQQVGPDRAYVYRVVARKFDVFSAPSAIDFASGVLFADHPIVAGITPARAAQLTQMRQAVDGLRLAAGLPSGIYSDTPQWGLKIRVQHITELRDALNDARRLLGYPEVHFSEPTLTPGASAIRASYFNQIMGGVQ